MAIRVKISVSILFLTLSLIATAATFELSPKESGTIFWRRSPYTTKKLKTDGFYGRCSRVLLKYDFSGISPAKFGEIIKATLILDVKTLRNPDKLPLYVGRINVPWTAKGLHFKSICWPCEKPKKKYLSSDRYKFSQKKGYFEYAWEPALGIELVPASQKNSTIKIDVSDILENIIFEGGKNNGFVLSLGGKCFGEAGLKSLREMKLSKPPVLKIELSDNIPTDSSQAQKERTLRYFPSALLPPVSDPYIFLWCCYSRKYYSLFWDVFKTMNTDGVYAKPELLQRGILSLQAVNGPSYKWVNSESAALENYTHPLGIAVDEWVHRNKEFRITPTQIERKDEGTRVDYSISALKKIRKANPEEFIAVYWRGEQCIKELMPDALPDIILPELYTRFPDHPDWALPHPEGVLKHLRWAEKDGFLDRIIPLYGILYPAKYYPEASKKQPSTIESVEAEIKVMRKHYPRIAGAGFFSYLQPKGKKNAVTQEEAVTALLPLAKQVDELLNKYYVEPAPQVTITKPYYNQKISTYHFRITVAATPKKGAKIKKYKFFIDNRLIAESPNSTYVFDCRRVENGHHMLTVHVVDSNWNRSAAQIPVKIELKR